MNKAAAQKLVQETLQDSFDKERFIYLVKNVLNHLEEAPFTYKGNLIFNDFADSIQSVGRIGKYKDPDEKLIDVLIVRLKKDASLDRARTRQRNFVAKYLKGSRGGVLKDAAIVAFVAPNEDDWRFSFVKMEYKFNEKGKVQEEFTPARRYSFLVGKHENSHTAQSRLLPLLLDDETPPTLADIENAFSVEKVTKEFFEKYRDLFLRLKDLLDEIVESNAKVKTDFKEKTVDTADFAKKLLGQIVFLYFLQKKGWFGVPRRKDWGEGDKFFLRHLFEKAQREKKNFFNDYLEPLFYQALRYDRSADDDYFSQFDCKIPFLNGGLFDPISDYDWINTEILLPDGIFGNSAKTKEGDIGDGILDIFDRYNFTVKEDEPLEKEVAIDPEMLGKVFENLLAVKDRKSKGTYYTPREIVHYMCQESLANYLATELSSSVIARSEATKQSLPTKEDIETLIKYGETSVEHDAVYLEKKAKNADYKGRYDKAKLPKNIQQYAKLIDEKLASIRVCDPAVGSGAFPVGMMNEIVRTRNALTPYWSLRGAETTKQSRTPYHFKRHAIQNCLYGVDIDPGAVEIAKLRLWLSLIVDEEDRETIQPLPNLDYKIICGNSLLSVNKKDATGPTENMYYLHNMAELEKVKNFYFSETDASKKQEYKKQIDDLISQITNGRKEFDFEVYFSEVFHEKKGFDVIITNPPYIEGRQLNDKDLKFLKECYFSAQGKVNLFNVFQERAYQILKKWGINTFIIPATFLRNSRYWAIRQFLLEKTKFLQIITFDEMQFEYAVVESIVILVQKIKLDKNKFLIFNNLHQKNPSEFIQNQFLNPPNYRILISGGTKESSIVDKVKQQSIKLAEIYEIKDGISTGFKPFPEILLGKKVEGKFISLNGNEENFDPAVHKKIIDGGEFSKYTKIRWEGRYIKYEKSIEQIPKPPKGHPFNCQLRAKEIFETKPRILSRQTSNKLIMTLDEYGFYTRNSIHNIYPSDKNSSQNIKYILALLNSSPMNFVYTQSTQETGKVHPQVHISDLRQLPIMKVSPTEQKPFIDLVNKILAITKDDNYLQTPTKQTQVREYEKQIDQLVYKLYGLNADEIRTIEN